MADKNNQTEAAENLSQLLQIRRDKLKQLQESGNDPFTITRFVSDNDSGNIKENFDALEGQEVAIAGRLMSKRGMGKVSFCDLQDKSGRIQLYARKDEMDEAEYNRFKKYDIGDIVGVHGVVFRTQRGGDVRPGGDGDPAVQVPAAPAREVPRPDQHRAALPPAVCGPDCQPGGKAQLRHPLPVYQACPGLYGRPGLY